MKDANKHCLIQKYPILINAAFSNDKYSKISLVRKGFKLKEVKMNFTQTGLS